MTKASYKVAALLEQTGFNHAVANSASDPTGSTPTPPDTTNYQTNYPVVLAAYGNAIYALLTGLNGLVYYKQAYYGG